MIEVTVTEADEALAKSMVEKHSLASGLIMHTIEDAIALALATARESARPPKGCVMDDEGRVLRVDGSLPKTKDNVVIGYESTPLWHSVFGQMDTLPGEPFVAWRDGEWRRTVDCYSSEEAALAAKEAGNG